jgi:hypothetical protein
MKIPAPKNPIDVAAAKRALADGMTAAEFARRNGYTPHGVRDALHKAGVAIPHRKPTTYDPRDRRLYRAWLRIKSRCELPSSELFAKYGARGVRVCREWHEFDAFRDWSRASGYRPGLSLIMYDRARGYRPSNCVWTVLTTEIRREFQERAQADGATRPAYPIDWDRALRLYVTQRLSVAETAAKLGASSKGVHDGLRARGLLRPRPTPVADLPHGKALHLAWMWIRASCKHRRVAVSMSKAWEEFGEFHAWAIKAGHQPGLVLTRLNGAKDYGPDNCRWLPRGESVRFHRPTAASTKGRWAVTAFGETKSAAAWIRDPRCRVGPTGLAKRLHSGMPPEQAITQPSLYRAAERKGQLSITAFKVTKSVAAWARDPRARVSAGTIWGRIQRGMRPEQAITMPAFEPDRQLAQKAVRRVVGKH